ncbi:MAG: ABC transporter permease [Armatimonadota bacterium]
MMLKRVLAWAGRYRIYWLCAVTYLTMVFIASNFLTPGNQKSLLELAAIYALPAIGFTLVLLVGHLDLSFGVCLTLGGMMAIGFQEQFGWVGSIAIALLCGLVCGLVNGVMVAKLKINSFIATLGSMAVIQGIVNIYSKGGTLAVSDYSFGDWLGAQLLLVLSPGVLIVLACMLTFELFLRKTRAGRGFFMVGGNVQTAWYAGLNTSGYIIAAFMLSGLLATLGGAINAISLSSANPNTGNQGLMLVIAAVIIGGTSMQGGKGSIVNSLVGVLTLSTLINGLSCRGAGYEAQQIASGLVLGLVVLYDALISARRARTLGQRPDLLRELADAAASRRTKAQRPTTLQS